MIENLNKDVPVIKERNLSKHEENVTFQEYNSSRFTTNQSANHAEKGANVFISHTSQSEGEYHEANFNQAGQALERMTE